MHEPPPLRIDHVCRISAIEAERVWSLRGDTLYAGTPQGEVAIPLTEISKVRLMYEPTRMQLNRYRCYLYRRGMECATIQNEHYKGFASFEDRSESYRELVSALLHRLEGSGCEFVAGPSHLSYLLQCGILVLSAIGLAFLLVFMGSVIGWVVIVKLILIACLVPFAWRWVKKNKPRKLASGEVPAELLPKGS